MDQSPTINYDELEKTLKEMAQKERDNVRIFITDPRTSYQERRIAFSLLEELACFMHGMFYCLEVIDSTEKADFYKEFFDQARSKSGLESEKK